MIEFLELNCEIKYVFLMQLYIIRNIIENCSVNFLFGLLCEI
jgi:hypothetical protein